MVWGYLSEFWNAITQVVIEGSTYTIEWFKSIGNAVAGAIGSLFDWILHYINDAFVYLAWVFTALKTLFVIFIAPITYIFTFIKALWLNAIKDPIEIAEELNISLTNATTILAFIPYWDTLIYLVGICILIVGGVGILLLILKI